HAPGHRPAVAGRLLCCSPALRSRVAARSRSIPEPRAKSRRQSEGTASWLRLLCARGGGDRAARTGALLAPRARPGGSDGDRGIDPREDAVRSRDRETRRLVRRAGGGPAAILRGFAAAGFRCRDRLRLSLPQRLVVEDRALEAHSRPRELLRELEHG